MMVPVIISLWIGSLCFGWSGYYPWLVVPVLVFALHAWRVTADMRAAQRKLGIPANGLKLPGPTMASANIELIVWTTVQHLALFGLGYGLNWLLS